MKKSPLLLTVAVMAFSSLAYAGPDAKQPVVTPTEPEDNYAFNAAVGYHSEYIFRGVDLLPGADGILLGDVSVSRSGFTLGMWYAHMLGNGALDTVKHGPRSRTVEIPTTSYITNPDSTIANPLPPIARRSTKSKDVTVFDEVSQTIDSYDEFDIYLTYQKSFGDFALTLGNILYLQEREDVVNVKTFEGGKFVDSESQSVDQSTVTDRVFVDVAYTGIPYVTPSLNYSLNVYSDSDLPDFSSFLQFKLASSIPVIKDTLSIDPYALVSYNFKDRAIVSGPDSTEHFTDWNHVQAGVRVPLTLGQMTVAGVGGYSQRITDTTGDDEFWWGGAEVSVGF